MTNHLTLDQALSLTVTELSKLPIGEISLLLEDVSQLKANAKRADEHIQGALHERFSEWAGEARRAKKADTGTVRFDDGEYVVIADLPKKVSYDQDGLRQIERSLNDMGEPAEEYITTKREVSERAYGAWPSSIRSMFDPYRVLGTGKPSYKIETRKGSS